MTAFKLQNLPVDSVSLGDPLRNLITDYLEVSLKVFPYSSDRFNRTGVSKVAFAISSQLVKFPKFFLPYFFIGDVYGYDAGELISCYELKQLNSVMLILLTHFVSLMSFRKWIKVTYWGHSWCSSCCCGPSSSNSPCSNVCHASKEKSKTIC